MDNNEQYRIFVETWKKTGPELDAIRRSELRNVDLFACIENLEDAFLSALMLAKPRNTSGLVEQQAFFQKLRR